MSAALSITVDVDGAAGLPSGGAGYEHRLSAWSERTYGITRGLERIFDVLDEFDVAATFYVPGVVAERHHSEVAALARDAARGLSPRAAPTAGPDELDPHAQRRDVYDGCRARSRRPPARRPAAIARPAGSSRRARWPFWASAASRSTPASWATTART